MHPYLLYNGEILESSARVLTPGQVGLMSGWGVFSTIRVFDGVLFAWERHWARMERDATLMRVPFPPEPDTVHTDLLKLVSANRAHNATLRLVVVRNKGGLWEGPGIDRDFDLIAFTTGVKDWGSGVRLAVQENARHAGCMFASTKILSWAYNLTWLEAAQQRGFDEVILLNERGEVAECTSANIFIEKAGEVYTPPLSSGCLPGITREILLTEGMLAEGRISERVLRLEDLYEADSVFVTSTTRDLLPVLQIEQRNLRRHDPCRVAMQEQFARYCDRYVAAANKRAA
jgi:branched-chain amino acid aminotransferase